VEKEPGDAAYLSTALFNDAFFTLSLLRRVYTSIYTYYISIYTRSRAFSVCLLCCVSAVYVSTKLVCTQVYYVCRNIHTLVWFVSTLRACVRAHMCVGV
jgi:hypothetical protein